jgi:hypothetical protein
MEWGCGEQWGEEWSLNVHSHWFVHSGEWCKADGQKEYIYIYICMYVCIYNWILLGNEWRGEDDGWGSGKEEFRKVQMAVWSWLVTCGRKMPKHESFNICLVLCGLFACYWGITLQWHCSWNTCCTQDRGVLNLRYPTMHLLGAVHRGQQHARD